MRRTRQIIRDPISGIIGDWFGMMASSAEVAAVLYHSTSPLTAKELCRKTGCPTTTSMRTRLRLVRKAMGPDSITLGATHALTKTGRELMAEAFRNAAHELRHFSSEWQSLRDENEMLKEALGMSAPATREWGLSPRENQTLGIIAKRPEGASHERLFSALYGAKNDPPGEKIIHVTISHMRRKLRPYGIQINTNWGVGYWMDEDSRQKVLAA